MIVLDKKAHVAINFDSFSEISVSAIRGCPALQIKTNGCTYKYLTDKGICEKMFFTLLRSYMDDDREVFDLVDVEAELQKGES